MFLQIRSQVNLKNASTKFVLDDTTFQIIAFFCMENARKLICHRRLSVLFILQNHKRLPVGIFIVKIAAEGSLKRVTGRIF
jgi:hypothetical protein